MSHGGGGVETKKWQYGVKSILPKINLKTEYNGCQKPTENTTYHQTNEFK